MRGNRVEEPSNEIAKVKKEETSVFKKNEKSIKGLIAPGGIDASYTNHIEISSARTRYARSMIVANLPRMCTFPEFLRGMYTFGDLNVSVFINPVSEASSQTDLNRTINELESERIVALDRGDINRERIIAQKRMEAEELRDAIAAGFNKLFDSSIVATIFAYSMDELEKYTELLSSEMSKNLIDIKPAWAMQDEAFRSNMPYCDNKLSKSHTFDRRAMSTVFPFFTSEVGHENGIPSSCPTSELKNGNTVDIALLSKVCDLFNLFSPNGIFVLNASSCIAHAGFISIRFFDISLDNNSVYLSNSSNEYANNVATIVESKSLLKPAAISSLKLSASSLFCANILSLFISPLSIATTLSDSNSLIVLFKSVCDVDSLTGLINTETFKSPNVYIPLKNSGKVHILGKAETIMLLAYLVLLETISI